jgi:hypothetical protein
MTTSNKKVAFGARPTKAASAEQFVSGKNTEPKRRLTLDIPDSLHRAIKAQCAAEGTTMVTEIMKLLVKKYGG